ncbi:Pentatricopeptide repeat-containing protein [Melia azedarach]|uniref:Pentatricopeptide repeat-containing protein n=2 Tax=Melia azedarach TaxID=155640 RepID=A0ACC1WVR0_MELAZ|nr:Pentatricopeptide repeat-containing protein [Melia azedarach]
MAVFFRFRTSLNLNSLKHRNLAAASIAFAGNNDPLTSKENKRDILSLLKSESNPERIPDICRAATLNPDSHPHRIAFSVAISKLAKANHLNGISQILEEVKSRPEYGQNESIIGHLIVLYGRASMPDDAMRTFMEIDKYGLRHSVNSLNALLFALMLAKNYEEVKRIFFEFPRTYGIKPNIDTYNRVIKAFCESGDLSSVYSILNEMDRKSIKPNATSFGFWLEGLYKEEKYEDVSKVLKLTDKYEIKSEVIVYNVRIQSLCKLKKSAEAKELLEEMLCSGIKPNSVSYTQLIYGFCKERNLEEAKKLFEEMTERGLKPDSNCYFLLVYFLCHGGDYETALKVCKESMEKGWVPNISTMKSLVNGLASVSKVDEAKKLVGLVKQKFKSNVDVWNEIEEDLSQ